MRSSVLVLDDHPLLRDGLRRLIDATGDLHIGGEAGSVRDGLAIAREIRADVVILDLHLGNGHGRDFLRQLKAEGTLPPTLVLSANDEQMDARKLLGEGTLGYLMKHALIQEILSGLRKPGHPQGSHRLVPLPPTLSPFFPHFANLDTP